MDIDSTIIAVAGTLLGATIGLLAGPVRDCFAHRTEIKSIRKAIYNELLLSCQKLDGAFIDFNRYITQNNTDMLQSTDKMYYGGPIAFSVYDAFRAQPMSFYQLAEASKLDVAYFRLNAVNDAVNCFSSTRFDTADTARERLDTFCTQFLEAAYLVNVAFEGNTHVLERIDKGSLFEDWRKFVNEHTRLKEKLSKKREFIKESSCLGDETVI